MYIPSHDFVTVEMRGLKAALVARAQARRVSVSALVRTRRPQSDTARPICHKSAYQSRALRS